MAPIKKTLLQIKISQKELKSNYDFWISKWKSLEKPGKELKSMCGAVFATHTFGYIKTINKKTTHPYREIFLHEKHPGLLSDGYRFVNGLFKHNEKRRIMKAARSNGLQNYVFAYLSIHDPYYGRTEPEEADICSRPFGIFMKKEIEANSAKCLPTRRDINNNSGEVDEKEISKQFLNARGARRLLAHQVLNDAHHKKDFWHYYGSPDYWISPGYAANSWTKRIEFHYYWSVLIEEVEAVLWPIWDSIAVSPGNFKKSDTYYAIPEIKSVKHDLIIIPYDLDESNPELSFIDASYYVTRYVLKNNKFPLSAEVAKNEKYD